jgi:NAD(P)-dependent dehydrogenase (short-subunit alcohol dehydrogenase family)
MTSKSFSDKTVLITGGASGIGRASAIAFAKAGANVFILDIDADGMNVVVDDVSALGGKAVAHKADVTKEHEVSEAIARCVELLGSLDYAHNNAAVIISKSTVNCTEEIWDKTMNTNLKGYWLCMKHEILQMQKQGHGNIVNTSSISGMIGRAGDMPYNVSKFGIIGLTKTAALENADKNIRINCVCPGAIQTQDWNDRVLKKLGSLHPMNRIGQPEEVANAVMWLCSDESSFVTGHSLVIDGGRIAGEW